MCFYKTDDRVKMTEKAINAGLNTGNFNNNKPTKGRVVKDQQGSLITVLRDKRLCADTYHASFWVLDY